MQGFKMKKKTGGKTHTARKNAQKKKKSKTFFDRQSKKITSGINKNIEEIMTARASEAKIRMKIVGKSGKSKAIKKNK